MIKYVKGDVSVRDSLNKNVSLKRTGVSLTPWYRNRVKISVYKAMCCGPQTQQRYKPANCLASTVELARRWPETAETRRKQIYCNN
jgi:hypothetical protein